MIPFKKGDTVYYVGSYDGSLYQNTPYVVFSTGFDNVGIRIKSKYGNMTVSYNYKKFISELEYRKKHASTSISGTVSSLYKEKKFKKDDVVYFIGREGQLKNNSPYRVLSSQFCGILDGVKLYNLTIKDVNSRLYDGFNANNFITKEEYEKNKNKEENLDDIIVSALYSPKLDTAIRMQIFQDTKSGVLKWTKPYKNFDDWFRAILKLKKPTEAYLRFDIKKVFGEWEMIIYYHRNKVDDSKVVRNIRQTNSLVKIARMIDDMLYLD